MLGLLYTDVYFCMFGVVKKPHTHRTSTRGGSPSQNLAEAEELALNLIMGGQLRREPREGLRQTRSLQPKVAASYKVHIEVLLQIKHSIILSDFEFACIVWGHSCASETTRRPSSYYCNIQAWHVCSNVNMCFLDSWVCLSGLRHICSCGVDLCRWEEDVTGI